MKIMVCEGCGRFIHRDQRCYHCGNTGMYPAEYDKKIHHAAAEAYAEMDRALTARNFARVTELSGQVLEWMGFAPDVYWMRLLARLGCSTDRELIVHGADLQHSSDYHNAMRYADAEEYQVFLDVRDKLEGVQNELMAQAEQHYGQKQAALDAPGALERLDERIGESRAEMLELWQALRELDQQLKVLDEQCRAAAELHRGALRQAAEEARAIKARIDGLKECSEADFLSAQTRLAAVLQMSEEAAAELEALGQDHPWLARYQELVDAYDERFEELRQRKDELREATHQAADLLDKLERLGWERQATIAAIRAGDFEKVKTALGSQVIDRALAQAGVK